MYLRKYWSNSHEYVTYLHYNIHNQELKERKINNKLHINYILFVWERATKEQAFSNNYIK